MRYVAVVTVSAVAVAGITAAVAAAIAVVTAAVAVDIAGMRQRSSSNDDQVLVLVK